MPSCPCHLAECTQAVLWSDQGSMTTSLHPMSTPGLHIYVHVHASMHMYAHIPTYIHHIHKISVLLYVIYSLILETGFLKICLVILINLINLKKYLKMEFKRDIIKEKQSTKFHSKTLYRKRKLCLLTMTNKNYI